MEKVQFQLESTLPEIKDLAQLGLFTQTELRQITVQRKKHETALIKRSGKPEDYLKYAQYEIGLEKLRKIRAKRLKLDGPSTKRTISFYSIPRRIVYILRRSTQKFPSHLQSWLAYVDYARSEGMTKLVAAGLTSALQFHPLSPALYIILSQHYLNPQARFASTNTKFSLENIPPARKTLLLGLRFLPANSDLWVEYIKLECGWVEALRRRWKVLGVLDSVTEVKVEGEDGFTVNPAQKDDDDEGDEEAGTQGKGAFGATGEEARKQLINGSLIQTILRNSFSRPGLSKDLSYRIKLLDLFRDYPTALRIKLLKEVYSSLESDFATDVTARRIWLEADLFDIEYVPGGEEVAQPAKYVPSEGEGRKVTVTGTHFVQTIAKVVTSLMSRQDVEDMEDVDSTWRSQWDDVVGLWILRWSDRAGENDDLRSYLLASLSSLIQSTTAQPPFPRLLASHLVHLTSLPTDSPSLPSRSKLLKLAQRYTILQPTSVLTWQARLDIEERSGMAASPKLAEVYLEAMDKVQANEGAGVIWVRGLKVIENLVPSSPDLLRDHWKSALKAAKKYRGDSNFGQAGEDLYSEIVVAWVKSVLPVLMGTEKLISPVVDHVLSPDWRTPDSALLKISEYLIGKYGQFPDLILPDLERLYVKSRHASPAIRIAACLLLAEWKMTSCTGRAGEAMKLVEGLKRELGGSDATGLEEKWKGILQRIEVEKRDAASTDEEEGSDSEEEEGSVDDISMV